MKRAVTVRAVVQVTGWVCVVVSLSAQGTGTQDERISLAGRWRFQLDHEDAGIREQWFERRLPERTKLPGSLPTQGIGDEVSVDTRWMGDIVDKSWFTSPEYAAYRKPGNVKVPFWLQPEKYYAGVAWYQREIEIPPDWQGKRVVLTLERPHWETRVWVDGWAVGTNNSLATPHEYDLGTALAPGKHRLAIRVDNRLVVDVGVNSHCISDHTQGNWNGIVGDIILRVTPPVWLEEVQVYPASTSKELRVVARIGNATGQAGAGELSVQYNHCAKQRSVAGLSQKLLELPVQWSAGGGTVEFKCPLPSGKTNLWDEFSPFLHPLVFELSTGDSKAVAVGLREISTQGTQFLINGRKTFFRGTLECCIFPLTGHPPTDVESWRRILRIAKSYGLNLLRFHSYCPPEAAFVAADELGFYYQVETCWPNQSTTLGDGKPVDAWVYEETKRILKAYGNHPSFLLMPHGNEPGGKKASAYLAKWVAHFRARDPRRLWTSGSGWPPIPENQFHVTPEPRVQHWGVGLKSRINARPPETVTDYREFIQRWQVPVISHEIGQWCVYPNFEEISRYRGCLKPKNFEIFRDTLRAHRMADLAHKFLLASGKLQTLCYKEDIESALRTPGMGGFELLDLHDFPGQGTALVGVLDPFWEDKGYVTAKEYSRFCNRTVPLARLSKRVFTTDETLLANLEVAHFGPAPLKPATVVWKLVDGSGRTVTNGWRVKSIPVGNGIALGQVTVDLQKLPAPARYKLVVGVGQFPLRSLPRPPVFENDWDLWLYEPKVATKPPKEVTVADALDSKTVSVLDSGGKVLLLIPPNRVRTGQPKVVLGFSSIFWNTAWTRRQPPTTLGILCDPRNPALAEFPTDYHSNWQWWYLVSQAGAMILHDLPKELRPTVQVIDDWATNRKLGLVFEGKMGNGGLLVCSIELTQNLERNPVARQLLHSLLAYMAGPKFKPAVRLAPDEVRRLIDRDPPR